MSPCCAAVHTEIWVSVLSSTVSLDGQCCVIMEHRRVEAAGEQGSPPPPSVCPSCLCLLCCLVFFWFLSALFLSQTPALSVHANTRMQILSTGSGFKCYAIRPAVKTCSSCFIKAHEILWVVWLKTISLINLYVELGAEKRTRQTSMFFLFMAMFFSPAPLHFPQCPRAVFPRRLLNHLFSFCIWRTSRRTDTPRGATVMCLCFVLK